MKNQLYSLIKKHKITSILMLILTVDIIHMYFTTKPFPPLYQLFIMLITGNGMLALFCLLYDKITSLPTHKTNSTKKAPATVQTSKKEITHSKIFKVSGVTFRCKLNKDIKRQDVLRYCSIYSPIHLEKFFYKKEPAYMIVSDDDQLDVGVVPEEIVPTILKYEDMNTSLEFIDIDYFQKENSNKDIYFAKVKFNVYKDA